MSAPLSAFNPGRIMANDENDSTQDGEFPPIMDDEKELRFSKQLLGGTLLLVLVLIGLFAWMDRDGFSKELLTCQAIALALTIYPIYQSTCHYFETKDYYLQNLKKSTKEDEE
jgi:hypothetical protein